ncbi:MAG: hypothetical protein GXO86_02040 [Chlorobi bacterium]|nr:hypothetical protein [Chlorobiota bacterium]
MIEFYFENNVLQFETEIRKEIRLHQIPAIIKQLDNEKQYIIIAQNIYPTAKEWLREYGISYLDASGNIFLKNNGIFIWIDSQKKIKELKGTGNRAFTKTGLKVLFHMLVDKELVNLPHREIASVTGVALGNIPQIITGLKEKGFLLPLEKKKYIWENRKELLNQWITGYENLLKPSLYRGKFKARSDWRNIVLNAEKTVWGGEPAGDLLTNHLRPEEFTLYTLESNYDLMKNYRLIPDEQGNILVYQMFWVNSSNSVIAPELLIYADLIMKKDKRCVETSQLIFDEFIKEIL